MRSERFMAPFCTYGHRSRGIFGGVLTPTEAAAAGRGWIYHCGIGLAETHLARFPYLSSDCCSKYFDGTFYRGRS